MRKLEVDVQLGKDLQYLVTFKGFGFLFFFYSVVFALFYLWSSHNTTCSGCGLFNHSLEGSHFYL